MPRFSLFTAVLDSMIELEGDRLLDDTICGTIVEHLDQIEAAWCAAEKASEPESPESYKLRRVIELLIAARDLATGDVRGAIEEALWAAEEEAKSEESA